MLSGVQWAADGEGQLRPFLPGEPSRRIVWAPQPGSQEAFLECPVTEALIAGNRGGGKTSVLLMDFAQHVGHGYGQDWRGILFRRTFPELHDVISKSLRWFSEIFPDAEYNSSAHEWRWPGGEVLRFRFAEKEKDYWHYHGHNFSWIGWEELTTWSSPDVYQLMFSCLRSSRKGIPLHVRATTNPYGVGHSWVKNRFRLPIAPGKIVGPLIETKGEPNRIAIRAGLSENKVLLHGDPDYRDRIAASARDPNRRKAWLDDSWDITSGGMIDDLWAPTYHVLPRLDPTKIPQRWRVDRAYDDGQSKPFSVGWYAQSNGEPFEHAGRVYGPVRGDVIRWSEVYGWNGIENQGLKMTSAAVAELIKKREESFGFGRWRRVKPGAADSQIWVGSADDPKKSVATAMEDAGVEWIPAVKGPGSRSNGWRTFRDYLVGAIPDTDGRREKPGFFVTEDCEQFLRTVPVIPRDPKDQEDVDTEFEDHVADEVRYRLTTGAALTGADRFRATGS